MEEILNKIEAHLKTVDGLPEDKVPDNLEKFKNNPDIAAEFVKYLENGDFPTENPLSVEGYTAKQIKDLAPFLQPVGVYNFLITLRTDPDFAKEMIENNFILR